MSELEKNAAAQAGKESVTPPAKAEKKAKSPDKKKDKKPNRVARWLKDLKGELKKVTWPSAKDTLKNVAALAELPSKDGLVAQLLGMMLAPITSLAIVIKAIAEQNGEPAAAEETPAE